MRQLCQGQVLFLSTCLRHDVACVADAASGSASILLNLISYGVSFTSQTHLFVASSITVSVVLKWPAVIIWWEFHHVQCVFLFLSFFAVSGVLPRKRFDSINGLLGVQKGQRYSAKTFKGPYYLKLSCQLFLCSFCLRQFCVSRGEGCRCVEALFWVVIRVRIDTCNHLLYYLVQVE